MNVLQARDELAPWLLDSDVKPDRKRKHQYDKENVRRNLMRNLKRQCPFQRRRWNMTTI